jgi:hypothetical protein
MLVVHISFRAGHQVCCSRVTKRSRWQQGPSSVIVHIVISESMNYSHSFLYNLKPVVIVVLLSTLVVLLT